MALALVLEYPGTSGRAFHRQHYSTSLRDTIGASPSPTLVKFMGRMG